MLSRDATATADDMGVDDDNELKQAQQAQGATALMLASCIHDAAVAVSATARCLKLGADVNARDTNGTTALMCAAREGDSHAKVVALLLAAGADPHIEEETQLLSALGIALTTAAGARFGPSAVRSCVTVSRHGPLLKLLTEASGAEASHAQMQWAVLLDEARRAGWVRLGTVRHPGPLDRDEVDECRRALGMVLMNRERA